LGEKAPGALICVAFGGPGTLVICVLQPGPKPNPADRIIVATARAAGARLLTRDAKLIDYGRRRHVAIF
jgi:PIN domain nuclease of toxin-antitoxin system